MNNAEIKNISIVGYLSSVGINPVKKKNNSVWYSSPLRDENSPSFKVDYQKNVWYDFGIGKGGNVIDLIMEMNQTGFTGALNELKNPKYSKFMAESTKVKISSKPNLIIKEIHPLNNHVLCKYLKSRNISFSKAKRYVEEAHYQINDRNYFALAFKNNDGGYELRSQYFKGGSSPKAITTIKGISKAINVFEGFFDFLTALEYHKVQKPYNTTIVLNSVIHLESTIDQILKFKRVNLYLDNDEAGRRGTDIVKSRHNDLIDFAEQVYWGYKDFNDYWMNKV
jgi:DNA primase